MNFLYSLSKKGKSNAAKEFMLETEAGIVKTLWFGFEDESVKPVFFDMHGGGFILMSADSDNAMNNTIHKAVGCKKKI